MPGKWIEIGFMTVNSASTKVQPDCAESVVFFHLAKRGLMVIGAAYIELMQIGTGIALMVVDVIFTGHCLWK